MARKIVCTPGTVGGAPRIDGTRMYCSAVVLYVANCGLKTFQTDYPRIPLEDVQECAHYCAAQKCLDDKPLNYCCDCTHDKRPIDPVDAYYGEKHFDVWKMAEQVDTMLRNEG